MINTPYRVADRGDKHLIRPWVLAALGTVGLVPGAHAAGNLITPNGRTATQVLVNGNTTNITTTTLHGGVAYNAFHQFREVSGKIVNLRIPHQAHSLLNMVYDGKIEINGVLNAYQNGRIGGHVIFADPQGLVVGAQGILNVGSLMVTTPTRAYMDRVLSATGHIDAAASAQLLAGLAPQSAYGRVLIKGHINAFNGISLQAAQVLVADSGQMLAGDSARVQIKLFEATVNTHGIKQTRTAVAHNGVITLIGTQQVQVAGKLEAMSGSIAVSAPQVHVTATAKINVSATNGGGTISIGGGPHALVNQTEAQRLTVDHGAQIIADASQTGNGGNVSLWSHQQTIYKGHISAKGGQKSGDGGQVEVSANTGLQFAGTVSTSALHGKMGTLLLDPNDLNIVASIPSAGTKATSATASGATTEGSLNSSPGQSYVTVSTLQGLGNTNIILEAFNSITLGDIVSNKSADLNLSGSGGPLSTGSLTLNAGRSNTAGTGKGNIFFVSGSSIETGGGAVTLNAGTAFKQAAAFLGQGKATLGSITTHGGNISIHTMGDIDLRSGATLDSTRANGGTAGNISLTAIQTVTNNTGLLSPSTLFNSVSPIKLDAGDITAGNTVTLSGGINAGTTGAVTVRVLTGSIATFSPQAIASFLGAGLLSKFGINSKSLFSASYFKSTANAIVNVSGNITGRSISLNTLSVPQVKLTSNSLLTTAISKTLKSSISKFGVMFAGRLEGTSNINVAASAKLTSQNALSIHAESRPKLMVNAASVNKGTGPSVTLAYGIANIATTANIASGATLHIGSLTMDAINNGIYSIRASSTILNTSGSSSKVNAGIALAFSKVSTSAVATEDASINNTGDVVVNAVNFTPFNVTAAQTKMGKSAQKGLGAEANSKASGFISDALTTLKGKLSKSAQKTDSSNNSTGGGTTTVSLASSTALSWGQQTAKAHIGGTAKIYSSGNVLVHATVIDTNFHNTAISAAESAAGTATKTSLSFGFAYGQQTRTAQSWLGRTAIVSANNMAIISSVETPLSILAPINMAKIWIDDIHKANLSAALRKKADTALKAALAAFSGLPNIDFSTAPSKALNLIINGQTPAELLKTTINNLLTGLVNGAASDASPEKNRLISEGKLLLKALLLEAGPTALTTFSSASAGSSSALGLAGSVTYLNTANEAQAWSAGTVTIGARQSGWTENVDGGHGAFSTPLSVQVVAPFSLQAINRNAIFGGAGNGLIPLPSNGGGSASGGKSVGGAVSWLDFHNKTQAWIAKGATLTASGNSVHIHASDQQRILNYAPSAGGGAGTAGNGSAAVNRVYDQTNAAVNNQATIDAGVLNINASSRIDALALAGAVASGQSSGIGVGIGLNLIAPIISAGILDTSALTTSIQGTTSTLGAPPLYYIKADSLGVAAKSQAMVVSLGVAGGSSGNQPKPAKPADAGNKKGLIGSLTSGFSSLKNRLRGNQQSVQKGENSTQTSTTHAQSQQSSANQNANSQTKAQNNTNQYQNQTASAQSKAAAGTGTSTASKPKISLAGAGSAALNIDQTQTRAVLSGAKIKLSKATGASVQALNTSLDIALAGAGAMNKAGGTGKSVAIAGTLAMNMLNRNTQATIEKTTLTLTDAAAGLGVQALSSGQAVAVGIGMSMAAGGNSKALATVVGSGSVSIGRDKTQALLREATLENTAQNATGDVAVQAYNAVNIGSGAGSLYSGGKSGIGMALSVAMIQNQTQANIFGGNISGFSHLAVQAFNPSQIATAAIVGGFAGVKQTLSLAGAIVINDIQNVTNATISQNANITLQSGLDLDASTQDSSVLAGLLTATANQGYDFSGSGLSAFGGSATSIGGQEVHGQTPAKTTAASSQPATIPGASIIGVAGNVKIGKGKISAGIATVYNAISNTQTAQLKDASVTIIGAPSGVLNISAEDHARLIGVAAGGSVGAGVLSAVGSFAINNLTGNTTEALLGDKKASSNTTSVQSTGGVALSATDSGVVWSAAGAVSTGAKTGVGAAMALNLAAQETQTRIAHTSLHANTLTLNSDSSTRINGLAIAVAASQNASMGGSFNVAIDTGTTGTSIQNSALVLTGALTNTATDSSKIWTGAGALGVAGSSAGVGMGVAVNVSQHTVNAALSDSTLLASGQAVSVQAKRSGFMASGAVGAGGSSSVGAGLAVVTNVDKDTISATISGVTQGGNSSGAAHMSHLTVNAEDSSNVYALGGAFAGGSTAGLGGAVTVNVLDRNISANLLNNVLTVDGALDVSASDSSSISSLGAAIAGSGNVALGGALTVNTISSQITSIGQNNVLTGSGLLLTIGATNKQIIHSLAVGIASSGNAAAGVAVSTNALSATTTSALTGGSVGDSATAAKNVIISAQSKQTIQTLAVGASASGAAAGAASVATSVLSGKTEASILGGAQVRALDNVAVLADDHNRIESATGNLALSGTAAAGVGVVVNSLNDTTQAFVGANDGTAVTALGQGTASSVASNTLSVPPNVGGSISKATYVLPALSETTVDVRGVAVNAQTLNEVSGLSAGVGGSGTAAVNVNTAVNVLGGRTAAYIDGANINMLTITPVAANSSQTVSVLAGRHDFAGNIVASAAGSGGGAGAAAVGVNTFDATTNAYIVGGTIDTKNAININARSSQNSVGLAAGLSAGGTGGVAGSSVINVYKNITQAYAEQGSLKAKNLTIDANNLIAVNLLGGSLGAGTVGVGATFLMTKGENSTHAWLGNKSAGSQTTNAVLTSGNLMVKAHSQTDFSLLSVTGAFGAGGAVAGDGNVTVLNNTTAANIVNAKITGTHNITVNAQDSTQVQSTSGVAVGSVGSSVGASANVLVFHDTIHAGVLNSDLSATGLVSVAATSDKAAQLISVTGSAGSSVGIGGALGLILMGSGNTGDAMSSYDKNSSGTLSKQQAVAHLNHVDGATGLSASRTTAINEATRVDFAPSFAAATTLQDATTATLQGGSVHAATLTLSAKNTTATRNVAGAASIGGALGIGAAIAITRSYDNVAAIINGTSVTAHGLSVNSSADNGTKYGNKALTVSAYAGGAGLGFSAGAAIADGQISNTVISEVNQAGASDPLLTGNSTGSLSLNASDKEAVNVDGVGAGGGAVTVGVVVGAAGRHSDVSSILNASVSGFNGGNISATGSGPVVSDVTGAAGGVFAANAAVATAADSSAISASLGSNITLDSLTGTLGVSATSTSVVSAQASGVNVGALSMGASVATADNQSVVKAFTGDNVVLKGSGNLNLKAQSSPYISSEAVAGAGGLIGSNAVVSTSTNNADVQAYTGNNVQLPDGNVSIGASQTGHVTASGTGIVGGALAGGAVVTNATSTPTVRAYLGLNASSRTQRSGNLTVEATGIDSFSAGATSGAGGIISGNAASTTTRLDAKTKASIMGTKNTLYTGNLMLSAAHTTDIILSTANSTNISAVGGGAALDSNTIKSTVSTSYAAESTIQATNASIQASNDFLQPNVGWNARGAAGGGVGFNFTQAKTDLTLTTSTTVSGMINVVGDPLQPTQHALLIGAQNNIFSAYSSAKVSTGGAVQGLSARASFTAHVNATTKITSTADLTASGNITVYAGSSGHVYTNAYAHTWGGAGVVFSEANAEMDATQLIQVEGTLLSNNNIWIGSGYNQNLGGNNLSASATSHAYNYTVFAVGTTPGAKAVVKDHNNVNVSGSVLAGANAAIQAATGSHRAVGSATGENSYQRVTYEIINFLAGIINWLVHKRVITLVSLGFRGGTSLDSSSSTLTIAGTVKAGMAGKLKLTLLRKQSNGQIVASSDSSKLAGFKSSSWNYSEYLNDRLTLVENQIKGSSNANQRARLNNEKGQLKYEIKHLKGNGIVPVVTLNGLLVQGGNITLNAGVINKNSATLAAHHSVSVTVNNTTNAFMKVGNVTIKQGGGKIFVNGQLTPGSSAITPTVTIKNTYTSTNENVTPPDLFLNGIIYNPTGAVDISNSAGSIHQNGYINASTVTLAAPNGGFFQEYQTGFHNPGNTLPVTNRAGIVAGGAVFVSAQYLNVNGLIQSGHNTLSTTLGSDLNTTIDTFNKKYAQGGAKGLNDYINGLNSSTFAYDPATGYVRITNAADYTHPDVIPAFWDPKTNHIILAPAQSQAGQVYLFGRIFNTNANAEIIAASGLAKITVKNNTSHALVIKGLNAGNANKGGIVRVTDTAKRLTITRHGKASSVPQVTEYHSNPTTGKITVYRYASGKTNTSGTSSSLTGASTQYNIANGGQGLWYNKPNVGSARLLISNSQPKSAGKADYPITIKFIGQTKGDISVISPAGIWLNGNVSNTTGDIHLQATQGVVGSLSSEANIQGQNVSIVAGEGIGDGALNASSLQGKIQLSISYSISMGFKQPITTITQNYSYVGNGSKASLPLLVDLVSSQQNSVLGSLSASTTTGNISLVSDGLLNLGSISAAHGTVNLAAANGIASSGQASSPTIISGGDLTILSVNGSVQADANHSLLIQVPGTLNVDAAQGGVNLTQVDTAGNLSVGTITAMGDVTISAKNGAIVSALSQQTNSSSVAKLKEKWDALGLRGTTATNEAKANFSKMKKNYNFSYDQYWQIKNNVTFSGSGPAIVIAGLTTQGYQNYQAPAAAHNSVKTASQTQVLNYVKTELGRSLIRRYQHAQTQIGQLVNNYNLANITVKGYLNTQDATGFATMVDSGLKRLVTQGAAWTQDQLLHTISQQQVLDSANLLFTQVPNIVTPGKIILNANMSAIGSNEMPVTIQTSRSGNLTLTATEAASLAAAAPGDVTTVTAKDGSSTTTIHEYHPVYTQDASQVTATALSNILLNSSGDLNIASFTNYGGQIRLGAQENLNQVAGTGLNGGRDGVVLVSQGNIGQTTAPLLMNLTGNLTQVSAKGGSYLELQTGNLHLGNFSSGGTGSIHVDNGGISSIFSNFDVPHIQAKHLILNTVSSVGGINSPLAVSVGTGGLSGEIGGDLLLNVPKSNLTVHNLTVHGVTDFNVLQGSVQLDNMVGGGNVTIAAAGDIQGITPHNGVDLTLTGAPDTLDLSQIASGIGQFSRPLIIDVLNVSNLSTTGGIYLRNKQSMTVNKMAALAGPVVLAVGGDLTYQHIWAQNDVNLNVRETLTGKTLISNAGNITSNTASNANYGQRVQAAGDITLSSGGGLLFGDVQAGGKATLESLGAQRGATLTAVGDINDTAGGAGITMTQVSTQNTATLNAAHGSISLDTLSAQKGFLSSLNDINIRQAWFAHQIELHANRNINAKITQRPVMQRKGLDKPLLMTVDGSSDDVVKQANLTIDTPNGVEFDRLHVTDATLTFTHPYFSIRDGYAGDTLSMRTPQAYLYMNNQNPTPVAADVQYFQPHKHFFLTQRGVFSHTDAYAEYYGAGYQVLMPNYGASHARANVPYGGGSIYITAVQSPLYPNFASHRIVQDVVQKNAIYNFHAQPVVAGVGGTSPVLVNMQHQNNNARGHRSSGIATQ